MFGCLGLREILGIESLGLRFVSDLRQFQLCTEEIFKQSDCPAVVDCQ